MSRLPPVPPASKPVHGPDGLPKTSVDISHRLRHQADKARRSVAAATPAALTSAKRSDVWLLAATGAVVAAILWLSGKQRADAAPAMPPKRRWQ